MKNILTVIGTRPQFIKYAAVSSLIRKHFRETLVDTGQHYSGNLSADFIDELKFTKPDYSLNAADTNVLKQMMQITGGLDRIINRAKPEMLVCFGDTNSTLAAATTALKHNIPIVHIEAGERNFDKAGRRVPSYTIPEEANRMMVDSVSSHLLCASRRAVENLKGENATGKIKYTGDIMYDLYKKRISRVLRTSGILQKLGLAPKSFVYCTIHRAINTESKTRLLSILNVFKNTEKTVILPIHPRTEKNLRKFGLLPKFKAVKNLRIIQPVGYGDSLALNHGSACVMTDSGGVVREAFFNSVPSIMIDDTSEWLDLFLYGWSKLTGADEKQILTALLRLKKPVKKPDLFGNGFAANKTVKYLMEC
jgi:UDP-N-acetylglucosamine 2-epimerase